MNHALAALMSCLLPLGAAAADAKGSAPAGSSYSMFQGAIKFSAPPDWPVMLQKTEGMPQFIAFQVKDPADQGSGEASQVSVEAKVLNDASTWQALVNAGTDKAKQTPGFERRSDGVDADVLRYVALNGKQRYEYRDVWYHDSKIFIHARCARPLLQGTSAAWTAAFESGCAQIMRTIKPH